MLCIDFEVEKCVSIFFRSRALPLLWSRADARVVQSTKSRYFACSVKVGIYFSEIVTESLTGRSP